MNKNIVVKIDGKTFDGWKSLEITQGMQQLCGSFAIGYSDKHILSNNTTFKMGQNCNIEINGHRLITGYIEEMDSQYENESHELHIRGRDKLGDLVDCCHWYSGYKGEFINQTISNIIRKLISKFNVELIIDDNVLSLANRIIGDIDAPFKVNEGDTIIETLIRLCREHTMLPMTYGDGKLYLTQASTQKAYTKLKLGVNIFKGVCKQSNLDRFSHYIVKGDIDDMVNYVALQGVATDEVINRHRPLVVFSEKIESREIANARANWEALVRAGKSRTFEYDYIGWLQENNKPWRINELVSIDDKFHNLQKDLLCTRLIFTSDESGTQTKMGFVFPETYTLFKKPLKIQTNDDLSKLTR